jgi:DNA-binding beta-propeller fold protein YncE
VIAGSKTGFSNLPPPASSFAQGIAVSRLSGDIFVANPSSNSILVFAANASGNISPIQTIAGSATQLDVPLNIALEE